MMVPSIRECVASDGYSLHFRHWEPREPKGIVIALHGIQSHSGWYEFSSRKMFDAGFAVYFADRRGSGLNQRDRGHAAHAMRLINDARTLTQIAHEEHGSDGKRLPVTLLGISWGGKIAAALAALFPAEFERLVLLYPGLKSRIRPNSWQLFRLNLARLFEVVKQGIPIPLTDPQLFTQDPEWQQFIVSDPLALHTVTSSFLNAGLELDRILEQHCSSIRQRTLLMLAEEDEIIDNAAVRHCVNGFGSWHLTTIVYPGARHTLEFEPNRELIFDELVHWLVQ